MGSTGAKGCCHGNQFLAFDGYNFGCIIASDMLFILGVDFWGLAIR